MATTSDFLIERLMQWGVTRIYGYPGDGISGITTALRKLGDKAPFFVQARHEEMAAFTAVAHAKFSGTVGVCMATSGPRRPSAATTSRRSTCRRCSRTCAASIA